MMLATSHLSMSPRCRSTVSAKRTWAMIIIVVDALEDTTTVDVMAKVVAAKWAADVKEVSATAMVVTITVVSRCPASRTRTRDVMMVRMAAIVVAEDEEAVEAAAIKVVTTRNPNKMVETLMAPTVEAKTSKAITTEVVMAIRSLTGVARVSDRDVEAQEVPVPTTRTVVTMAMVAKMVDTEVEIAVVDVVEEEVVVVEAVQASRTTLLNESRVVKG